MGGHDCYCALCGAALYNPIFDDDVNVPNDEKEYEYDREVIRKADAEWMNDSRMLAYNADSPSIEKVYMTGRAYNYEDLGGSLECEPSDDASFPTPDQHGYHYTDDRIHLDCYKGAGEEPERFPIHWACYQLFSRVLRWTTPYTSGITDDIDREILYRCFKALYDGEEFGICLTEIDYGTIGDHQDQYWCTVKGSEYFAMNPLDASRLHDVCSNIPRLSQLLSASSIARPSAMMTGKARSSDPFSNLPTEMILRIMLSLPTESVEAFQVSSRAVACLDLGKSFWKSHMRRHLPWLYDLPVDTIEDPERVAWKQVNTFLLHITSEENPLKVPGLANRRRIFGICEQIADEYWKQEAASRREEEMLDSKLEGTIISTRMTRIASDIKTQSEETIHATGTRAPFSIQAIAKWADVGSVPLHIRLIWGEHEFLAAIQTALVYDNAAPRKHKIHGAITNAGNGTDQTVVIQQGSWITSVELVLKTTDRGRGPVGMKFNLQPSGFVQVGSFEGDRRILEVRQHHIFLGFHGEICGDHINHLALLQGRPAQPELSLIPYTVSEAPRDKNVEKYVWSHSLPPRNILAHDIDLGYWMHASTLDLEPMEALLLGLAESELSSVTAISGDVLLGGFAVHYSDGKRRNIGPRHHAMKQFSISGSQGERIDGMGTGVAHLPQTVVFKTNWGRQCIFGPWQYGKPSQPYLSTIGTYEFIGFYAGWMYEGHRLTSCSMLLGPADEPLPVKPDGRQWICDEQGRFWDVCSFPADWIASGPIWGNNQDQIEADAGGNHRITSDPRIVSWLDVSKAIETIEIWFTHPLRTGPALQPTGGHHPDAVFPGPQFMEIQFVSLILRYSDGTTAAVGPQEFDDSYMHPEVNESSCDCFQNYGRELGDLCKKPLSKLHYRCEKWQVGGTRVTELRVWSSVFVEGMQFVTENGRSSPIFGNSTEGQPTGTIDFGEDRAVGVKLFSDGNSRPVTSSDVVIMGVQAVYQAPGQ